MKAIVYGLAGVILLSFAGGVVTLIFRVGVH